MQSLIQHGRRLAALTAALAVASSGSDAVRRTLRSNDNDTDDAIDTDIASNTVLAAAEPSSSSSASTSTSSTSASPPPSSSSSSSSASTYVLPGSRACAFAVPGSDAELQARYPADQLALVAAVVAFRHGARTPSKPRFIDTFPVQWQCSPESYPLDATRIPVAAVPRMASGLEWRSEMARHTLLTRTQYYEGRQLLLGSCFPGQVRCNDDDGEEEDRVEERRTKRWRVTRRMLMVAVLRR
jgi:hypothetical protein